MIHLKRIYEPFGPSDGYRVLVERLWPRGISKSRALIDLWLKEISPSPGLRTWYNHDQTKWDEFQERYRAEIRQNPALETITRVLQENPTITFVFAARDEEHNSAWVLKRFLEDD